MGVLVRTLGGMLVVTTSTWLAACGGDESSKLTVPLARAPELTVPLARAPYMGVSCDGRPNWIGCAQSQA